MSILEEQSPIKLFDQKGDTAKLEQIRANPKITDIYNIYQCCKSLSKHSALQKLFISDSVQLLQCIIREKYFQQNHYISTYYLYNLYKSSGDLATLLKHSTPSIIKQCINYGLVEYILPKLDIKKEIQLAIMHLTFKTQNTEFIIQIPDNAPQDLTKYLQQRLEGNFNAIHAIYNAATNQSMDTDSDAVNIGVNSNYSILLIPEMIQNIIESFFDMSTSFLLDIDPAKKLQEYLYSTKQTIFIQNAQRFLISASEKAILTHTPPSIPNFALFMIKREMCEILKNANLFLLLPMLKIKDINDLQQSYFASNKISTLILQNHSTRPQTSKIHESTKYYNELHDIENHKTAIASRQDSDDFTLRIKNYHLTKHEDGIQSILRIPELTFEEGAVYRITAKNGAGKTTFLLDTMKCLNTKIFQSTGTIFYPTYNGHKAEIIFCGTEIFQSPETTLFERITYRLPREYVTTHHDEIKQEIVKMGGILNFIQEKFDAEHSPFSKGQNQLLILLSAILYKRFLKEPVVLLVDETLAHLDTQTLAKAHELIQKEFSKSIILFVDHSPRGKASFYQEIIDLNEYTTCDNNLYTDTSNLECKENIELECIGSVE